MKLSHYDIIKGTSIDYMHCILLGVTKLLLSLWFGARNKTAAFYIKRKIAFVDKRLLAIKPPSKITGRPRKLSEHMKYYKAVRFYCTIHCQYYVMFCQKIIGTTMHY